MRPHREIYKEVEWTLSQGPTAKEGGRMTRADITVETYYTGKDDYMVDIVRSEGEEDGSTVYDAWLYRRSGGIKTHIFGVDDVDYATFRRMIEEVLATTEDLSVMTADGEEG